MALVDSDWATVGSSNLDPLSLALNLEANVIIRDRDFNERLYQRLQHVMRYGCKQVTTGEAGDLNGKIVRNGRQGRWNLARSA